MPPVSMLSLVFVVSTLVVMGPPDGHARQVCCLLILLIVETDLFERLAPRLFMML